MKKNKFLFRILHYLLIISNYININQCIYYILIIFQDLPYKLGVNKFVDWTLEELKTNLLGDKTDENLPNWTGNPPSGWA